MASALACGGGGLLLVRRLGGAFPAAPGPMAVAVVAAAGLLMLVLVDAATRHRATAVPFLLVRMGLAMGVAAVALPLRASSPGPLICGVLALVAAALAIVAPLRRRPPGSWRSASPDHPPTRAGWPPAARAAAAAAAAASASPSETGDTPAAVRAAADGTDVRQRFARRSLAGGGEEVEGMLRVCVPRGTRLGWGHVGFCPPFPAAPTVEVATGYDGVEAIVAAAEVLPWGVRVEVRLDEPAEETLDVPVAVVARTAA